MARKISPKCDAKFHDIFGREKWRKISLPHLCRVAALTIFVSQLSRIYRVVLNLGFGEDFAPQSPLVFVISVVSVIFATPASDPLVCGSLSCLRHFRGSRRFRAKHRIAKHRFRNTRNFTAGLQNIGLEIPKISPRGLFFERERMPSLVGERQFGRYFRRQFGRG